MQPLPSEGLVQATEISSLDTIDISTTVFGQFSEYFVNKSSWRSKMPLSAVSSSLSASEEIKNLVNFRGIMPILSACTVTETKDFPLINNYVSIMKLLIIIFKHYFIILKFNM